MKQELIEAVTQYKEKAYHDWKRVTTQALLFVVGLIVLVQGTQCMNLYFVSKACSFIEHEVANLQNEQISRLNEAKQLKEAHALSKLIAPPIDIAAQLKAFAHAIPEHTLLTELSYDIDTGFKLVGFSRDTQEIRLFLANLKAEGLSNIQLNSSQDEAAGRKFIMTFLAIN